jgi:hypothetical protein
MPAMTRCQPRVTSALQRQRTHGPQSIACSLFAGETLFIAFVVGFAAGEETVPMSAGRDKSAGDETALVAAGRERSAALQVIGFFGWQTFPNTFGATIEIATTTVRMTRDLRIEPSLDEGQPMAAFCDIDHITSKSIWRKLFGLLK